MSTSDTELLELIDSLNQRLKRTSFRRNIWITLFFVFIGSCVIWSYSADRINDFVVSLNSDGLRKEKARISNEIDILARRSREQYQFFFSPTKKTEPLGNIHQIRYVPTHGCIVGVGQERAIYSLDKGGSWNEARRRLGDANSSFGVLRKVFSFNGAKHVYTVSDDGDLWASEDCKMWRSVYLGDNARIRDLDFVADERVVIAGGEEGVLYKISDQRLASYQEIDPPAKIDLRIVRYDPYRKVLLLSDGSGVINSSYNLGKSWNKPMKNGSKSNSLHIIISEIENTVITNDDNGGAISSFQNTNNQPKQILGFSRGSGPIINSRIGSIFAANSKNIFIRDPIDGWMRSITDKNEFRIIKDIGFIDDRTAIAVGNGGFVSLSNDGGKNWAQLRSNHEGVDFQSVVSVDNGEKIFLASFDGIIFSNNINNASDFGGIFSEVSTLVSREIVPISKLDEIISSLERVVRNDYPRFFDRNVDIFQQIRNDIFQLNQRDRTLTEITPVFIDMGFIRITVPTLLILISLICGRYFLREKRRIEKIEQAIDKLRAHGAKGRKQWPEIIEEIDRNNFRFPSLADLSSLFSKDKDD